MTARSATDDEGLHRVRTAAKRLRYAAEVAVPAYGKDAKRVAKAAKRLQRPLGDLQDARLARDLLHDVALAAEAAGEPSFTYGLWAAREEVAADAARDRALGRLARATRRKGRALRLT